MGHLLKSGIGLGLRRIGWTRTRLRGGDLVVHARQLKESLKDVGALLKLNKDALEEIHLNRELIHRIH